MIRRTESLEHLSHRMVICTGAEAFGTVIPDIQVSLSPSRFSRGSAISPLSGPYC